MSTRLFMIVGACIAAGITLYYIFRKINKKEIAFIDDMTNKNVIRDTIYFKSKDASGNISSIHDSGIKPSYLKGVLSDVTMNVVKYEYVDGIEKLLDRPVEIFVGQNIYNVVKAIKLDPHKVQEKRDHYTVSINNLWR